MNPWIVFAIILLVDSFITKVPSFRKNNKNKKNSYLAPLLRLLCW